MDQLNWLPANPGFAPRPLLWEGGAVGLVQAELFPTQVRALGVVLSYAVANTAFGGSAEYVALWFKSASNESYFYYYVTALCAVALLVAFWIADTRHEGHLGKDDHPTY